MTCCHAACFNALVHQSANTWTVVTSPSQEHTPSLELMGSKLSFDASHQEVTLFIANLKPEYDDDDALRNKMQEFGKMLRCFIGRNPAGQSKVRHAVLVVGCRCWHGNTMIRARDDGRLDNNCLVYRIMV